MYIHSSAIIDPSLDLPADLKVGPYAILDQGIKLSRGVSIGAFCHLYSGVTLEENVCLSDGVILGNEPQDLKYRGEITEVFVGANSKIREYVTINRGTAALGKTVIGKNCLIMAYTHVAHDCVLGDNVILANAVQMGGHVVIGDCAVVAGMTGIHQFVTVGCGSFIGGGLRVDKDILPFSKGLGEPLRWAGLNEVGFEKFNLPAAASFELKDFYRELFVEGKNLAVERVKAKLTQQERFHEMWNSVQDFLQRQSRGMLIRSAAAA